MERRITGELPEQVVEKKKRNSNRAHHTSRLRKFKFQVKEDIPVKAQPEQLNDGEVEEPTQTESRSVALLIEELEDQNTLIERLKLGAKTHAYFQRVSCPISIPAADREGTLAFDETNSLQALAYATIGQAYTDYERGTPTNEIDSKTQARQYNDFRSAECFMYPMGKLQEERTLFVLELAHLPKSKFVLGNLTLSASLGRPVPAGVLPSWIATREK